MSWCVTKGFGFKVLVLVWRKPVAITALRDKLIKQCKERSRKTPNALSTFKHGFVSSRSQHCQDLPPKQLAGHHRKQLCAGVPSPIFFCRSRSRCQLQRGTSRFPMIPEDSRCLSLDFPVVSEIWSTLLFGSDMKGLIVFHFRKVGSWRVHQTRGCPKLYTPNTKQLSWADAAGMVKTEGSNVLLQAMCDIRWCIMAILGTRQLFYKSILDFKCNSEVVTLLLPSTTRCDSNWMFNAEHTNL